MPALIDFFAFVMCLAAKGLENPPPTTSNPRSKSQPPFGASVNPAKVTTKPTSMLRRH